MREEQINALKEYIDAVIALRIEEASNRFTLSESVRKHDAEQLLDRVLSDFDDE